MSLWGFVKLCLFSQTNIFKSKGLMSALDQQEKACSKHGQTSRGSSFHKTAVDFSVASGAVEHKLKVSEQHYTYIDMDLVDWDHEFNMWKPKGTIGDK